MTIPKTYQTANARWAGLGPYYAMFPSAFADKIVARHSMAGDTVLDPFAGRGTSLYSAMSAGRRAIGFEVNPVGWVYAKTKLKPASREAVSKRILEISRCARNYRSASNALPPFFHVCYSKEIREFLLAARGCLNWRRSSVDRTVMAFLLVHLHGKPTDAISNQMMQTKAMSPQYALDWWRKRDMSPPEIDPVAFFQRKLDWRYAKGIPSGSAGVVTLGDCTCQLPKLIGTMGARGLAKPSLMLTSPPYFGVTNYHYDQWIRLWLLGGPPTDRRVSTPFNGKHKGKFANDEVYRSLLTTVFNASAKVLRRDAIIYVRTDWREPTLTITRLALKEAFPSHSMKRINQPLIGQTQTRLFGYPDQSNGKGEVDFILRPHRYREYV